MIKVMKSDTNNGNTFGKLSEEFVRYAMDKEMNGDSEDYEEVFSHIDKMLKEHYEFNSQEELNQMGDIFFGIYTGVQLVHTKYYNALKDNWDIIKKSIKKYNDESE